jgi:hypothetical protein
MAMPGVTFRIPMLDLGRIAGEKMGWLEFRITDNGSVLHLGCGMVSIPS